MKSEMLKFIAGGALVISVISCSNPANKTGSLTKTTEAAIDFTRTLQDWDGFGVNYVEVAQTTDYRNDPQEYGGFSLLSEEERQEIIELTFGDDGLKPAIIKMFFDPFQQENPSAEFDHKSTTKWRRYCARE